MTANCETSQDNFRVVKLRAITRHQSLDTEGQSQTDAQGPRLLATRCKLSLSLWRIVEERWRRQSVGNQPADEAASGTASRRTNTDPKRRPSDYISPTVSKAWRSGSSSRHRNVSAYDRKVTVLDPAGCAAPLAVALFDPCRAH